MKTENTKIYEKLTIESVCNGFRRGKLSGPDPDYLILNFSYTWSPDIYSFIRQISLFKLFSLEI